MPSIGKVRVNPNLYRSSKIETAVDTKLQSALVSFDVIPRVPGLVHILMKGSRAKNKQTEYYFHAIGQITKANYTYSWYSNLFLHPTQVPAFVAQSVGRQLHTISCPVGCVLE